MRYQLVNVLLLQGEHEQAVIEQRHIAERAVELNDDRAQIEVLSQLVALEPNDVAAAEHLAEITV